MKSKFVQIIVVVIELFKPFAFPTNEVIFPENPWLCLRIKRDFLRKGVQTLILASSFSLLNYQNEGFLACV